MAFLRAVTGAFASKRGGGKRWSRKGVRELGGYAEGIRVANVDGPGGMSIRPSGTTAHVEAEWDHYADEQFELIEANGYKESRAAHERAASVDYPASQAEARVAENLPRLRQAQGDHDHAQRWLLQFTHRPLGANRLYGLWFALLMLGDAAGVFGAAVMWGELIPVALGQALASGAAAVAAGWVGADVRDRRDAQARARLAEGGHLPEELTSRYPALFGATGREPSTYGAVVAVAVIITLCLASAIFALRASVESSVLIGFVYGGLAAATALGSFINAWRHADQVADLLERSRTAYRLATAEHDQLVANPAPSQRDAAAMAAGRIEVEHLKRASAAKHGVLALQQGILRRNPQIFGHAAITGERPGSARGSIRIITSEQVGNDDVVASARPERRQPAWATSASSRPDYAEGLGWAALMPPNHLGIEPPADGPAALEP